MSDAPIDARDQRLGLTSALGAHLIWGVLPLYLKIVGFASAWEVLGQRVLWSIPAAAGAMAMIGGWRQTRTALAARGVLPALALSGALIGLNWTIFVWAVAENRVIEASLAYFIAPMVNVAVGLAFFGERLVGRQGLALGVAAAGVLLQGVAVGHVPWVSLGLAATWAAYAVVRKQAPVPAAGGLLAETVMLAPIAIIGLWLLAGQQPLAFTQGPSEAVLLALAGPFTSAPLILFALGARRISFVTLGLIQYLTPSLQLTVGLIYGEAFGLLRAASFALIWIGLIIFTLESLRAKRRA